MTEEKLKLTIAHLYPKILNLYGDYGNIITLQKRCEFRNIDCEIVSINIGDKIDESKYDIYFIGGGQDKQQIEVSEELKKQKEFLINEANNGKVFLAVCGGFQLLGKYSFSVNGEKITGVGLLDSYVIANETRFIGNVTVETDFLTPKTLVGFENHAGLTYLENDTKPLAKVIVGNGNNAKDEKKRTAKHSKLCQSALPNFFPFISNHFSHHQITSSLLSHQQNISNKGLLMSERQLLLPLLAFCSK